LGGRGQFSRGFGDEVYFYSVSPDHFGYNLVGFLIAKHFPRLVESEDPLAWSQDPAGSTNHET
jgi:hypothetical protein